MRPRHLRWISLAMVVFLLALAGIGYLLDSTPIFIVDVVCIIAYFIFLLIFARCPYCHRHLRSYWGDYCPFCGENMNDPE